MDVIFLDGGIGRTDDIKPVGRDILERYRHFARRIGKGRGGRRHEDGREQVARGVPPYCIDDVVGFGFQPGKFEGVVTLYELGGKILLEADAAIRAEALSLRRTDPINSSVEAYLSKSDFRA